MNAETPKNIFIMGLDPFHLKKAKQIRHPERYRFHGLLEYDEVIMPESYPMEELIAKADRQLRDFPGRVDALIAHWDFPVSTMLPILCKRFGLRTASLESVLRCEHKYWARLEQQAVIPEFTPRFQAVDPFADDPLAGIELDYPFWLKPVKAFGSHLGFRVHSDKEFRRAIEITRKKIRRLGDPFNVILGHADRPEEIAEVDGNHCVAEEIVVGKQCGLEGYILDGHFAVHGVVDCVKDEPGLSFTRYELPSVWPEEIQVRMADATQRLFEHIGYDGQPYGIEFFWNEKTGEIKVLEVNTRISQSHSDQFIKVAGVSNHEVAIDVALGREPEFALFEGAYRCAAKFLLRKYADAVVKRIPTEAEIEEIRRKFPDSDVVVTVKEGGRLSELRDQDSYSYEIANIFLGAQTQHEMLETYHELARSLDFRFSDGKAPEGRQFREVAY